MRWLLLFLACAREPAAFSSAALPTSPPPAPQLAVPSPAPPLAGPDPSAVVTARIRARFDWGSSPR